MPNTIKSAFRITLVYALFAACWILFSDMLVEALIVDPQLFASVQTFKGMAFVAITAVLLFLLVVRDNKAIEKANDMDSLTGLHNINLFIRVLNQRLLNLKPDERLVLGYLDIDGFRQINESIGFERADELLKDLASHLERATLDGAIVARIQADQFASFSTYQVGIDMDAHIRNIQSTFNQRCRVFNLDASCCIGVALYPEDGSSARQLMVAAAEALNVAKQKKNCIQFHDKALTEKASLRRQMLMELQDAISKQQLSVVYQPKYQLADLTVSSVEVLIRWNHPDYGLVSPMVFIPLAEENGLSGAISRLVIAKASEELVAAGLLGNVLKHVAINVSAAEFNNAEDMLVLTQFIARQSSLAPYIRIEITETATLHDMKKSRAIIANLQQSGITFSVDDFGTGYTSLAMLKDLTVDEIKIDRSFVAELVSDQRSKTIVDAIIAMAKSFDINVVAEGVETAEQLAILTAMGCQQAQGYFLGRPMPIADLVRHIEHIKSPG